ncbi:MAG TPA: hypothetical protein VG935_01910, partial [Patescibacteria group bacterium]|nr:hypothetical protein [Patescibacteria group bacterium]
MNYLLRQHVKRFNRFLVLILGFVLFAITIPTIMFASKRYHHFHNTRSQTAKTSLTPTPSPLQSPLAQENNEDGTDLLQGQWSYLPGASKTDSGLSISETDMAIVAQDGKTSVSNAPINLAGTYLKNIVGNMTITAGLFIPQNTTATMQLYSQPPIIADEFRIEKASLQLSLSNGQLQAKVWN